MKIYYTIFCFLLFTLNSKAQTPGVSIFYEQYSGDDREYIEYIPGNLPIIISAPHGGIKLSGQTIGGTFYPDNDSTLPDRNCGTNERDDNTDILIREIQANIFALTGCYAHVIINNLHRSKLDPNREEGEAACGDADAEDHWDAFHDFIDDASSTIEATWGKGLYIDLHGQSHSIPRIEIGFNITADQINNSDLNIQSIIDTSTIKKLVSTNITGQTHEELIRGTNSLGELFQEASGTFYAAQNYPGCGHNGTNGYRAIPSDTETGGQSCDDTQPFNNSYFDGDFYNNRRHGSGIGADDGNGNLVGGGGNIDGIMTEVNRRVRDLGTYMGNFYDNNPQTLVPFAADYAGVILDFVDIHYNDFTTFDYGDCNFSITGPNPYPTIAGLNSGIFSSTPPLAINPETGEIDLTSSSIGVYTISIAPEYCDYFSISKTIEITNGSVGYVDQTATGEENGKSWTNAYKTLEDALNSTCVYDTVKIAEGDYIPNTSSRSFNYGFYNDLVIQGGYSTGGTNFDPAIYEVIINGNIGDSEDDTDNLYHSIYVNASVSNLNLSYLTISSGYADGSGENSFGAGIYNKGIIRLQDIVLTNNNHTEEGKALFNEGDINIVNSVRLNNNSTF